MKPRVIFISTFVAGMFFIAHVNTLERTVHVQGENYKLKKLKDFINGTVERVNVVGGRIFYKLEKNWFLLSNVGGPDYAVNPYKEVSCNVANAHTPGLGESYVQVKSKTFVIDQRCDVVWYCELNTLVVFTCATEIMNNFLTHFYFFDMAYGFVWEPTRRYTAERFPLLATDFPGYGGQSYGQMHADPLTEQIVFRMNNNYDRGGSIWSIRKVTGKWNDSL